jgi:hypothetical protein
MLVNNIDIKVFGVTFIRHAQNRKIGNPNDLKPIKEPQQSH